MVVTVAGAGLLVAAGLVAGRRSLGALRLPAAAVVIVALAAAALSVAPGLSLVGGYSRYESLPVRLAYVGLLCGAAWIGERERTVTAFLLGCGLAATETVFQAQGHLLPRPDGNLGQPNLLGALLAMAIPLAVQRSRGERLWLVPATLYGLALILSTSRSGWLGALAGVVAVGVFWAPARLRWPAAAAAAVVVGVAAAVVVLSPLRALNQDTGAGRLGVWRDAAGLIAERPLLGWGEDATGLVFGRHQSSDWEPGHNFDRAHSMPLDLAATQGLAGLAACTWLFATWWRGIWGRPELAGVAAAAAAYLAWSLLNFDWAPATAPVWLLAGAAWPGAPAGRPAITPPRLAAAGGAALLGLAVAVPPLLADLAYYAGQPARAAALDPLQPRYRAVQADLPGLRAAAELGDTEPATYVALGDAEAQAGDGRAAQAAYRRALELYPYDPEARRRLA